MVVRRSIVRLSRVAFCFLSIATAFADSPNIVVIVSDDQGYHDLGCFGNDEIITPNLDRIAADGVRLTNFYVSWPACTPSRGSLLTGRYPQRNGIYDMIRNEAPDYGYKYPPAEYEVSFERIGGMDLREALLSDMLSQAGYTCGIFGKWDLGTLKRFLPTSRGFDDFYGFVNTGIDYFTHERYGVPSMYRDLEKTTEDKGVYATELFRREALRFIDANHEKPFFLYLPFNAPHSASNLDPKIRSGAQGTPEYKAMYPELAKEAGFNERDYRYGGKAMVRNKASRRLEYVASVTEMDHAIGDVMDRLEQYGVSDSTLVVFFSDNGGGGGADNSPLKGHKAQMWEGGIRVPCLVKYPSALPAGSVSDAFLTSLELVPTVLAVTPATSPDGVVLDGYNMLPTLAGNDAEPRTEMFWQRRADRAARIGDWKWVDTPKGGGLFDLSKDVGERNDLSGAHSDKLAELKSAFDEWTEQMKAAEPRGPFRNY